MAEGVRLDIVLTDDGQPAQRPSLPPSVPSASPAAQAQAQAVPASPRAAQPVPAPQAQPAVTPPPARLGGESPEDVRAEQPAAPGGGESISLRGAQAAAAGLSLVEGGAKRAAAALVPLAQNDYMPAFKSAVESVSEGLSMAGQFGMAAGVALKAVAGTVESAGAVVQSFIDRGKQLAQFSPELAMSNAKAEITSMIADMREAQELGGGIGRMQDAQTELLNMLRETLLPLKKWVVETLAGIMEVIVQLFKDGYAVWQNSYAVIEMIPDLFMQLIVASREGVEAAMRAIELEQKRLRGNRERKEGDKASPMDALVDKAMQEILGRATDGVRRGDPVMGGL